MQFDFFTVGLLVLVAVMIFFMFRSSRRRRRDAEELQSKIQPGAEVMTQHGIYGTLISLDEDKNEALIETTPGTVLRVHRQIIARVVDPTLDEAAENDAELEQLEESGAVEPEAVELSDEPEFGERVEKPDSSPRPHEKPTE